jgi:tubulin-folding cofactor B
MSEYTVISQSFVNITIISEVKEFGVEKRYPKDTKVFDLKNKLEIITGYLASDIKLRVLNKEKKLVCDLDDDEKMIGFYPIEDGFYLEVLGSRPIAGVAEDPTVQKYELTAEEYASRKNTVREFKKNMKLGQFAENHAELVEQKERQAREKIEAEKALIDSMKVGDRCQVRVAGAPTRLAAVMYLGELDKKPGFFVGVKYDEPLGKNDGSVEGKRYFECPPNYGGFIKPENITVGDFPEENFDDEI